MNRRIAYVGAAFLLAAFLVGFVPQYIRRTEVQGRLETAQLQLAMQQDKSQLDAIALLMGKIYLEVNLKNYGIAGQYASTFYNHVHSIQNQTDNPNERAFVQEAIAKRDAILTELAKGDGSVVNAVQDLFQRALQVTSPASDATSAH